MEENQKKEFIELYSFKQKKYSEIQEEMSIARVDVQSLFEETRDKRQEIQNIRNKFTGKRKKDFDDDFSKFYDWYEKQDQKCGYCGISQGELYYLFREERKLPLNNAIKRSSGTLEIERKDSAGNSYNEKNIILACPLCNNAKSNLIDEGNWADFFVEPMQKYYAKLLKEDKGEDK